MLMSGIVRVRFVMSVNGSRSVHFRRKLRWLISEEKPSLQSEKFQITPENARWSTVCGVRNFPVPNEQRARAIIHLDMDCFYAAIEVRDRPSLRGKPVGVGGARERRGVLTTCNYEARKFGVRSAMPTFMALQRCPNLIVLPTRFDVYRREAAIIRGILYQFTSIIEPLSLDEAYLDVGAHPTAPVTLAKEIRSAIFRTTKLTSSAGIGPNKLIAKIASEINKPNGQFEVRPEQVAEFMKDLPVRKIWGIGEKSERKLEELGVKTCGEVQRFSRPELVNVFGKFGLELYDLCRGIDDRPVEPDRPRKSLSTEETFAIDLATLEQCEEKLEELFQDVMADLAQKESTREITKVFVKLKFNDFTRTTAERAGLAPTLETFRLLLVEAFARTGKPVRLIGVGVRLASMPEKNETQLSLL
jgi:DNA polymerase IV